MPPSYPSKQTQMRVFTQAKVTWPEYPSDPYGLTLNWNVTDGICQRTLRLMTRQTLSRH